MLLSKRREMQIGAGKIISTIERLSNQVTLEISWQKF
jgi:hypothetical protein